MAPEPNPDEERLARAADDLVEALDAHVAGWIEGRIVEIVRAWSGHVSPTVAAEAVAVGEATRADAIPELRALLATDIDEQTANPLDVLRRHTGRASAHLASLGVPAVRRDAFAERSFPGDDHGLVPATWADIHPAVHEPGLTWSAAKAFVFKARRRAEGRA